LFDVPPQAPKGDVKSSLPELYTFKEDGFRINWLIDWLIG
jgi:hypothetical protein